MKRAAAGFTLIELVVSLAIFSVIYVVTYETLGTILDGKRVLDDQQQQWRSLEITFTQLDDDLRFACLRPVRDVDGTTLPPMAGAPTDSRALSRPTLELTRSGISAFASNSETGIRRVGYRLKDNNLYREIWPSLDRKYDAKPTPVLLANGIEAIDIRYLDDQGHWVGLWPADAKEKVTLPRAVDITLTLVDDTRVNRLYLING